MRFFIENGLHPDTRAADMVFPHNPTAVAVAVALGDEPTVRYLIEHGADITLVDRYGHRPYSLAAKHDHESLKTSLKNLEDPRLHDVEYRSQQLTDCGLPLELIDFLRGEHRRIELGDCEPKFIEFHDLLGVREMQWEQRRIFDLLAAVDDYWETGFLVWSPQDRKLAHADYEHDHFQVLCDWPEFLASPRAWIESRF